MTDEQDKFGRIEVRAEVRDATPKTELPLRVLVIGDFVPDAPKVQDWEASSHLVNITPGNLHAVMEQLEPRLKLNVPNRLSDSPKEISFELSFPNIQAFRPAEIAMQLGELACLLSVRRLVSQLRDGSISFQEFEEGFKQTGMEPSWLERFRQLLSAPQGPQQIPPAKPEATKPGEDMLDSLLGIVDTDQRQPGEKKETGAAEARQVDSLIRAVIGPPKSTQKADKSVIETAIDELDGALSGQINEILHHSRFQGLESSWRGLKFLQDRADLRENIKLEILPAHKDELRFAIYHQVFTPEYNELSETPLSVMIADYDFNCSAEDIELLYDIARMANSLNVPFIASVGPEFFGLEKASELGRLPMLRAHFQQEKYNQWNELRADEASQYVSLTASRFLLRFPYGPDGVKIKEFNFVEQISSPSDYLWGRGVFALGAVMVRSFAANGWCINITGVQNGGMVENLPLRPYRVAARDVQIPLDVLFNQSREKEFWETGFIVLSSRINEDKAFILAAPTIHRPKQYTTAEENMEAYLHASLPYQLFSTRMAHCLQRIAKEVSTGLSAEQIKIAFMGKLRSLLAKPGVELSPDAVIVEVSDNKEKPGSYDVALRIRPPFQILGQDVDLLIGLQLQR